MTTFAKPTGQKLIQHQVGLAAKASEEGRHADAYDILRRAKANMKRHNLWGDNKISAAINFLMSKEEGLSA